MEFAERQTDFENTQLKTSYLLSSNAGPDSTQEHERAIMINSDVRDCIYSLSLSLYTGAT